MNDKFETLKTANEYMDNLIGGINKAVEYFQSGEENKGCELIPLIAEGIQWLSEALVVTSDIHKQEIDLELINEKLNEIVEAFENQDFILVGDLFQYEVIPVIENIKNKIETSIAN